MVGVGSGLGCQSSAFLRVFWLKAWLCGWGGWGVVVVVREVSSGEQLLQTNGHLTCRQLSLCSNWLVVTEW